MKELLKGIIFCGLIVEIILGVNLIVEVLSNIITMEFIMTIVYIMLGVSIVYLLKNL